MCLLLTAFYNSLFIDTINKLCHTLQGVENMNELQQKERDLLKIFVDFCNKHNLKYYLVGGTLLGAIRHKGFIPWDDDIDVAMLREDYDKFCELAAKEFTGDIFFQSYKTDKNYPYIFSKLRDSNTTFVEAIYKHVNMNHGVYIDIFPVDGLSKKSTNRYLLHIKIWLQALIWFLGWPVILFRKPRLKFFLTDILIDILVLPFFLFRINNWSKKAYEKITTTIPFKKAKMIGIIQCGDYRNKRNAIPKELLYEFIDWPFEDLICKVPKEYDKYLTYEYGDYMKLPPNSQQVGHHYSSGFDLHLSYKDYMKKKKK